MSGKPLYRKRDYPEVVDAMLSRLRDADGGLGALSDTTEGSVVRTLVEVFAQELSVAYAQLEHVYNLGYLDTAHGDALDMVVALLGVKRRPAGSTEGRVVFSRVKPASDDVSIPAGTHVTGLGEPGAAVPLFETVRDAVLDQGSIEVAVQVRSVDVGQGTVEAGQIILMPRPIWGVEQVTNPTALLARQNEETDDELRERARHAIDRANVGTVAAIEEAVRSLGLREVRVQEKVQHLSGEIDVVIGDEGSESWIATAREVVDDVRPAGVRVHVMAAERIFVKVTATIVLEQDLESGDIATLRAFLTGRVKAYIERLGVNQNVRWRKVRNLLADHDSVLDVELTKVPGTSGEIRLLDPFVPEVDHWEPVAYRNLVKNKDILIRGNERASLDLGELPIDLSFEPPALDVWVDVRITLAAGTNVIGLADAVQKKLEALVEEPEDVLDVSFKDWTAKLFSAHSGIYDAAKRVEITVIHDRDGQAITLSKDGDADVLTPRERPQARPVQILFAEVDDG